MSDRSQSQKAHSRCRPSLAGAVFEAIPALAGTVDTGFDFSIFTGDLVSHDPNNELSRDYVMYTEVSSDYFI